MSNFKFRGALIPLPPFWRPCLQVQRKTCATNQIFISRLTYCSVENSFYFDTSKKSDFLQSFLGYSCNCNVARTFIIARLEPTTGSVHVISRRVDFIPSSQHTCSSRSHLSVFVILCQKAIVTCTCCRSNGFYSR